VADSYAARELATIAYQCEAGGLHVCETRYLEIIAHGQVGSARSNGRGRHNLSAPIRHALIRYKIGDMGAYQRPPALAGAVCRSSAKSSGTHDFLVTADGQFVHGEFFRLHVSCPTSGARYQVYQPDKEHSRCVCLQAAGRPALLDRMHQELQARFGQSTHISSAW